MAPNCCCFPLALSLSMVLLFLGLVSVSESKPWGVPRTQQQGGGISSPRSDSDDHTILGIDLGGKWVKAAVFQGKDVTVIEDDDNSRKEAAIVSFLTNERTKMISFERLFGRPAQRQLYKAPQRTLIYATDVLGRRFTAYAHPDAFHPYDVVPAGLNTSRAGVRVALAPGLNVLTAEEAVAMLLRHVKAVAEASPRVAPGTRLHDCVIAVRGAVATAHERAALVDAARIAGLNVIAVVSGTTASAIAYAKDKPVAPGRPYRMAIVDMGATALDAAVLDISEAPKDKAQEGPAAAAAAGTVVPRGSACDGTLGGRAFAARLADLILRDAGLGSAEDAPPALYYRAFAAAEKAMEVLSVNTEAFYTLALPERDYAGRVTRAEFEAAAKDLLGRVPGVLKRALEAAGTTAARLDDVQIVGGATRIPAVQAAIQATLAAKELHTHISADEGACIGAAYLGAHIDPVARMYVRRKVAVRDVATLPVLLRRPRQGAASATVFPVGAVVKSVKTVTLPVTESTIENGAVSFVLAHPDAGDASRCSEIARFAAALPANFSLEDLQGGAAALRVTVALSLTGIPAVERASLVYGAAEDATPLPLPPVDLAVTAEHLCIAPLSPTEFAAAVQHLATLDSADEEKRAVRKAKNDLEEYLLLAQRFLSDTPRAAKFAKAKEVAALQKAVDSAEEWFESCPDEDSALDPVPKSDFEEKLAEVRKLGDAILLREAEAEARPHAVALLRHALAIARADLTALAEKSKDSKAFVDQFLKRCAATEAWMEKVVKKQAARALNEAPAFLTDEVDTKLEELRTLMIFADYSEYSDSNYRYGGSTTTNSEMKAPSTDSSVWTDVVSLDGDERVEL